MEEKMGQTKIALFLALFFTCACEPSDAEHDGSDVLVDDAPLDADAGQEPDTVDKVPFTPTNCAADPAAALVEVRLTDLEIAASVSTAPAAESALSVDDMAAVINDMLMELDYPYGSLAGASRSLSDFSDLDLVRLDGGDPFAAGAFHRMTARPVVIWAGDWLSYSRRYFPQDPLETAGASLFDPAHGIRAKIGYNHG